MRHLRTRTIPSLRHVTDPATGRRYPIPAGGADDSQQQDDTDQDDADDGEAGTDTDGDDQDDADDGDDQDDDADTDQLGDAGKQALDRMKAKWKKERDRRRELEQQLTDGQSDDDADGDGTDDSPDPLVRANERILKAEIKAAAAGRLADPTDAYRFLDLTEFEVDDDGNVDVDEITDAIETLVASKPYLAAQGDRRFKGTADGGARKGGSKPKQLTRDDLKRMSPEEIRKAEDEGRLNNLLGRTQ